MAVVARFDRRYLRVDWRVIAQHVCVLEHDFAGSWGFVKARNGNKSETARCSALQHARSSVVPHRSAPKRPFGRAPLWPLSPNATLPAVVGRSLRSGRSRGEAQKERQPTHLIASLGVSDSVRSILAQPTESVSPPPPLVRAEGSDASNRTPLARTITGFPGISFVRFGDVRLRAPEPVSAAVFGGDKPPVRFNAEIEPVPRCLRTVRGRLYSTPRPPLAVLSWPRRPEVRFAFR